MNEKPEIHPVAEPSEEPSEPWARLFGNKQSFPGPLPREVPFTKETNVQDDK